MSGFLVGHYGGVDFDLGGALAVLTVHQGRETTVRVYPTPTVEGAKSRREYDVDGIAAVCHDACLGVAGVLIEAAHALPAAMGGSYANFLRGRGSAAWETALAAQGIRRDFVRPAVWKKQLGLRGGAKNKRESIAKAKALVPACAEHLRLVSDHGKAEAVLLAYLAWQRWGKV